MSRTEAFGFKARAPCSAYISQCVQALYKSSIEQVGPASDASCAYRAHHEKVSSRWLRILHYESRQNARPLSSLTAASVDFSLQAALNQASLISQRNYIGARCWQHVKLNSHHLRRLRKQIRVPTTGKSPRVQKAEIAGSAPVCVGL